MSHCVAAFVALLALAGFSAEETLILENGRMKRVMLVKEGTLSSVLVENKVAKTTLKPIACDEFALRLSRGTDTTGTDIYLTAKDFEVVETRGGGERVEVTLKNAVNDLKVKVIYTLGKDAFYGHKQLEVTSGREIALERMDVESISFSDAIQPYTLNVLYASGKWSPGLGQPLYTTKTATFWGTEFPASRNVVEEGRIRCGYLWGKKIKAGETYRTHRAVFGVGDDPEFIEDTFLDYIDEIRIRPLRLQVQYNSWFDFGPRVTRETFADSVKKIHEELVVKRGCRPLAAYVIDDGWQDSKGKDSDWSGGFWPINSKFDGDFAASHKVVKKADSTLGLWYSIGCFFGSKKMVSVLGEMGYESLGFSMSMAGPRYMAAQEKRIMELIGQGVTYFKFDGTFGHLNTRAFEVKANRGVPVMPQLIPKETKATDAKLNDTKYDEAKMYYMTAGTERMMELFQNMHQANPAVFMAITNGAYLSPWWLMHVDIVWLINSGDAAGGAGRTGELVYRDGIYHEIWETERTQFPMNAIFNHEPKKKRTGESREVFRDYLLMNMSRGTGFIELYIKTAMLSGDDWDELAAGVKWAERMFPCFRRVRMHGGDPLGSKPRNEQAFKWAKKNSSKGGGEVYGFTSWNRSMGYVSIHNPNKEARPYAFTLDRKFGLLPGSGPFRVSSPVEGMTKNVPEKVHFGDTLSLELKPGEIRMLEFHASAEE